MVAILVRRICNDIQIMKRHKEPNDSSSEEASMRFGREDVHKRRSPPRQPPAAAEESRDPQAAAASPAAAPLATVITSMSDMTYNKTPSFEQRDEHRSAFSPVQSDEVVDPDPAPEESKHQDEPQETSSPSPMPPRVHRRTDAEQQEPLPYQSPIRYYQQQEEEVHEEASEAADTEAAAHQYHQYSGYPYHNPPYDYSGYYNPSPPDQDRNSTPMSGGQYHHAHYTYHHQEYPHYSPSYSHHYSYYPSQAASSQQQQHPAPAYPVQYHHQSHHYYYPGTTSPDQQPDHTAKEPPSAVTQSTKGTTPSAMAQRAEGGGDGEGLDPSLSRESPDEDRKPPAVGRSKDEGSHPSKENSPRRSDYEPIPLDQFAGIPELSSAQPSSPPPHDAFPDAFPGRTKPPQTPYAATSRAASSSVDAADASAHISPPVPRQSPPSARRRSQRTLAPSSSGSAAGSPGEGGSWERRYQELMEFKRVHSHCEVPQNYAKNTSLGTWVNKQRMEHKNRIEGKNSSLNDSRLERLERIGFRWAKRKGQASWNEKFNELVAYKAKFGNCHVPTKFKNNTALGRWVSTQRAEYKKYQEGQAKTSMNVDKIQRLESIGFAWFMAL